MNKRVNMRSSSLLPEMFCPGFAQQTGVVLLSQQNDGSAFIINGRHQSKSTNIYIKGTKTKKFKPNKNLSHSIQFNSHHSFHRGLGCMIIKTAGTKQKQADRLLESGN